jgi:phenylacetate-CoA ligase
VRDGDFRYIRNWKISAFELSSDFMDENNIEKYYELLLRYEPRLIRGHPQSIQYLIELLQCRGLTGWRPRAENTKGEMLHDFQRRQIEKAWQVPELVSFGLVEHNVFIAQCPEGSYHISPE